MSFPENNRRLIEEIRISREGKFEVHIATPEMPRDEVQPLIRALENTGFPKNKYFLKVYDVSSSQEYPRCSGTPPVGHDLDKPMLMSTAIVAAYEDAIRLVKVGMALLDYRRLRGNFEIERVITESIDDFPEINIEKDLPGFKRVQRAPLYETHVIFCVESRTAQTLSDDALVAYFRAKHKTTPHQIVDFSIFPPNSPQVHNGYISRVVTFYQPTREAALDLTDRIKRAGKKEGFKYVMSEQVCLVGEPA